MIQYLKRNRYIVAIIYRLGQHLVTMRLLLTSRHGLWIHVTMSGEYRDQKKKQKIIFISLTFCKSIGFTEQYKTRGRHFKFVYSTPMPEGEGGKYFAHPLAPKHHRCTQSSCSEVEI